jgi:hypothetical protein
MADLEKYPDAVWDRFFGFVFPDEEPATREEVQQELQRLGLDVKKAVARVQLALQAVQARADLEAARAQRHGLTERLKQVVAPVAGGLRAHLQTLIGQKLQGSVQAAYFRKLEHAATDDDLQSLLEDMYRLEALQEGADDVKPAGE